MRAHYPIHRQCSCQPRRCVTIGRTGVVNVKALHFHVVIPHRAALWRQIAPIGQPGFRFNRKVRRSQLLGEVLTDGGLVLLESKKVNGSAGGECRAKEGQPGNVVPVVMGE